LGFSQLVLLLERFGLIAFGVSAEVVVGFGASVRLLLGDCERELCIDPVAAANQGEVSLALFIFGCEQLFFSSGKSICFR
jgi:hypothetical protein